MSVAEAGGGDRDRRPPAWALGALAGTVLAAGVMMLQRHVLAAEAALPPLPSPVPPAQAALLVPRSSPAILRYSSIRYALAFAGPLADCAVLAVLVRMGGGRWLPRAAARAGRFRFLQDAAAWALLSAVLTIALLPLSFYSSFWVPHQFGLSRETLGTWMADLAKSTVLGVLFGGALVAGAYAFIRRSPRRWWMGVGAAAMPVLAFSVLIAPLVVDPLFNRFTPLPDSPLQRQILALAGRAGIPDSRVFEVDASRRTKQTNAYVTGLGKTARIVIWDTTLQQFPPDELLFIVGHEVGHYVLLHIWQGLAASAIGVFGLGWMVAEMAGTIVRRRGSDWGIESVGDLASLPLLMLIATSVGFLAQPAACALSRRFEHQADRFGLAVTQDRLAAARGFIRLGEGNLGRADPPAFVEFWMGTHPALGDRIRFALSGR